MTAVFGVPVDAAYHLVLALTNFLSPVLGGLAAVAAIVVFTMAIRLLLTPLSFRALRGQAAMTRLAPQVQELRKRYGRQPERLQRELTALYAREGTGLLAGFVPLLAQCSACCTCCSGHRPWRAGRTACCLVTCSACRSARTG
jgi:YidC/Oxa1 family membrane protein insertase